MRARHVVDGVAGDAKAGSMRGGDDLGMSGEVEIIIGAKIEDVRAAFDRDVCTLRRSDNALTLVESALFDGAKFSGKVLRVAAEHEYLRW